MRKGSGSLLQVHTSLTLWGHLSRRFSVGVRAARGRSKTWALEIAQTLFQFLTLPHNRCVTLGKWLSGSGPCFFICKTGMLLYILRFSFWELNEMMPVVHSAKCLACDRCLITGGALEKEVEKSRWACAPAHVWGLGRVLTGSDLHSKQFYSYLRHNLNEYAFCSFCCFASRWLLRSRQETGVEQTEGGPVNWHHQHVISHRSFLVAPPRFVSITLLVA